MNPPSDLSFATTIHVRDTCLCLHAQRAARALSRRFDIALRPVGLTSGQYSLLISLNRPEPPTLGAVATLLAMDRTTLTANVKPLVKQGFIEVIRDRRDRRSRRMLLTTAGRDCLSRALPIWVATHAAVEADIAAPQALRDALNELSSSGANTLG